MGRYTVIICHECRDTLDVTKKVFRDYYGNIFCSSKCKWLSVYRDDCSQYGKRPLVPGSWHWAERQTFERDGWRCQHCGSGAYLEAHHKIPISKNGNSLPENLITLCHDCHIKPGMHRGTRSRSILRAKKVDITIQQTIGREM